jgi:hypothetical protein
MMSKERFQQVGLSADWSVEAYHVKSIGEHDIMVFDRDDTGIFWSVVRVNRDTDGEDINSSSEAWYEDENNWQVLAVFEALLDADLDADQNEVLSRGALEEAFKYAEAVK